MGDQAAGIAHEPFRANCLSAEGLLVAPVEEGIGVLAGCP